MTKGIKLWKSAKKVIPGGNGLLSKRPERYLPKEWPTYYSKSKDINIWDLENNKYLDMAQKSDYPPSHEVIFCRKMFRELLIQNLYPIAIRQAILSFGM